ncbi:MAG: DNA polymerase III subunit gamma/tau, partial [Alkalimonas sp.]|nr:DNA polymerase III subunit gamma/tau [Alkalimonas sp.]
MSYQVLARKWRPQQFAQLVGQSHVKSALINALNSERLHHAYLFTGTRGVGKTTIARIFAKSLNCETGVTAEPCGVCSSCQEIEAGHFVDLLEIDAASRTKVEDTRDLLDNVQYAPTRGRFKVYLIDEVHMLSRHSFNALLKTLEEPPPHVKFLLATTDPQKLPVTVLSRCLQFSLKALSETDISHQLATILQQEQIPAEDEALRLLAKAARGSVRDALSLTDQAIAQTNSQITAGAIRDMLGFLPQQWGQLVMQSILQQDVASMRQQLEQLLAQHSQPTQLIDDLLALLHYAAITQFQPEAAELAGPQADYVRQLATEQSAESLQLYYQLLIAGKRELAFAPDVCSGLEMALLRALLFVPAQAPIPTPPSGERAVQTSKAVTPVAEAPAATPTAGRQAALKAADTRPGGEEPAQLRTTAVSYAATEHSESQDDASAAAMAEHSDEPEPTKHQLSAEPEAQPPSQPNRIDPITASIMARRGVQVDASAVAAQPDAVEPARAETPTEPEPLPTVQIAPSPEPVSSASGDADQAEPIPSGPPPWPDIEDDVSDDAVVESTGVSDLAEQPAAGSLSQPAEVPVKKPERRQAQQLLAQELDAA